MCWEIQLTTQIISAMLNTTLTMKGRTAEEAPAQRSVNHQNKTTKMLSTTIAINMLNSKILVRETGFEPVRQTTADFKSAAATSYATLAKKKYSPLYTLYQKNE
jgi:hypothetical protein